MGTDATRRQGEILGIDRCPETKTRRRKIGLFARPSTPFAPGQSALARN